MISLGYLFAAYTIVWLALLAYLFFVSRGIGRLRQEVQTLRDILIEREPAADASGMAGNRPDRSAP